MSFLVVMAGGSGTRFWPKSTSKRPKQLLSFGGADRTLLQETVARFDGIVPEGNRLVVTSRALGAMVRGQAPSLRVLEEPKPMNTAPCVYWAAREIAKLDPKGVMLVAPSDHYVSRPSAFAQTIEAAIAWAQSHDDLVTLGVKPTRPETGYGYLRTAEVAGPGCFKVAAFVEKPPLERAREFVAAGNYFWNGGMFVWRVDVILRAFDEYMPEMRKIWDECGGDVERAFPRLTATSIDYGVMEKASNVVAFPLDCGWDDLGSWTSLESIADVLSIARPEGVVAAGDLVAMDTSGVIVDVPGKLVAMLGVDNLIVVEHEGTLMIAHKDRAQEIKKLVDLVKAKRPDLV